MATSLASGGAASRSISPPARRPEGRGVLVAGGVDEADTEEQLQNRVLVSNKIVNDVLDVIVSKIIANLVQLKIFQCGGHFFILHNDWGVIHDNVVKFVNFLEDSQGFCCCLCLSVNLKLSWKLNSFTLHHIRNVRGVCLLLNVLTSRDNCHQPQQENHPEK